MNKTLKLITITCIILTCVFFFATNKAFAAIDMNLASNLEASSTNAEDNSLDTNTSNTTNTSSNTNSNTSASTTNTTSSATVSTLSSLPESELGLTNILNILLITVGVILILLGIAIIIKLKK
jgi:CBS domain containing-hemolysin-like protein